MAFFLFSRSSLRQFGVFITLILPQSACLPHPLTPCMRTSRVFSTICPVSGDVLRSRAAPTKTVSPPAPTISSPGIPPLHGKPSPPVTYANGWPISCGAITPPTPSIAHFLRCGRSIATFCAKVLSPPIRRTTCATPRPPSESPVLFARARWTDYFVIIGLEKTMPGVATAPFFSCFITPDSVPLRFWD